jgi:hypothetical protein
VPPIEAVLLLLFLLPRSSFFLPVAVVVVAVAIGTFVVVGAVAVVAVVDIPFAVLLCDLDVAVAVAVETAAWPRVVCADQQMMVWIAEPFGEEIRLALGQLGEEIRLALGQLGEEIRLALGQLGVWQHGTGKNSKIVAELADTFVFFFQIKGTEYCQSFAS